MRQISLDTETTGLEVRQGHRLVEIACVEILDRRVTSRYWQTYLNPGRAMDAGASQVTGIRDDFLLDKPAFGERVDEFLAFIDGAELVIHNASFDVGFLDAELARLDGDYGKIADRCSVLDTLTMARERYPGQRNNLDALCKRLGVDNSRRDLHGGLIDAQLLADVYLAMTSGQVAFNLDFEQPAEPTTPAAVARRALQGRPRVLRATDDELMQHAGRLAALDKKSPDGQCAWRKLEAAKPAAPPDGSA